MIRVSQLFPQAAANVLTVNKTSFAYRGYNVQNLEQNPPFYSRKGV